MKYRAFVRAARGGWLARGRVCSSLAEARQLARQLARELGVQTGAAPVSPRRRAQSNPRQSSWADIEDRTARGKRAPHAPKILSAVPLDDLTMLVTLRSRSGRRGYFVSGSWVRDGAWGPFDSAAAARSWYADAVRPNPVPRVERAAALVERFTRFPAREVRNLSADLQGPFAELGRLVAVEYRSDKFDGRARTYRHKFETRPVLAATADGRVLVVLGGRTKVTARGIEG